MEAVENCVRCSFVRPAKGWRVLGVHGSDQRPPAVFRLWRCAPFVPFEEATLKL